MSELVTIVMERREKSTRSALRVMRSEGFVPCVFYGPEVKEAIKGKVDHSQIAKLLRGSHWETMRLNVRLPDNSEEMCLIREVQRNVLTGKISHIDFMKLIRGRKITVNVPVVITGEEKSPGIKGGGIIDHVKDLEIETTPANMPESIVIDISALGINDSVHVRDISVQDYVIITNPNEVVASILPPRLEEDNASAGTEQKEVEVVTKGKAAKGEN
ncbi:MAG: 50S ribosomal protein L25 [Synergistaceae bacterium]|nr:50S ribosomal protein L25 [Synergistaceae bacterium]